MVIAYRPATPADASNLSVLAMQVFLDTYATNGINTDLAKEAITVYSTDAFKARLSDPSVSVVLALSGEYLVGFADVALATRCPTPDFTGAEIFRLYVQRPFLRRGVGRALLQKAEQVAQAHHLAAVWLTAWAGNSSALSFYKALGYMDVGATEYVIEGKGYENRVLCKRLATSAA